MFSKTAEETYEHLSRMASGSKIERSIFKSINKKIEMIRADPHYGRPVPERLIPKEYNVSNLFHVELSNFWRMLYTLTNNESEVQIIAIIVEISDHKAYDKRFGYKKL